MSYKLLIGIVLALAGCATTVADRAARVQAEVEEMIQVYSPACEKLGYEPDSDKWRDCILRLASKDQARAYTRYPTTTTCTGHRGFYNCTTF